MAKIKELTVAGVVRSRSSFTFHVAFTDGTSAKTKFGAQINHMVENPEYQDARVRVEFDRDGRIARMDLI